MIWRQRFQRQTLRFMVRNSDLKRRRLWVVVMYAALTGWAVPSLMLGLPQLEGAIPSWTLFAVFALSATLGALRFLVTASTSTHVAHGLEVDATSKDTRFDERQKAVWDRAMRKAYQVVLGVLLVITGYWLFVWPLLRLPEAEAFPLLSLAFFCLLLSLPNAIIAWTEPEVETEGDAP